MASLQDGSADADKKSQLPPAIPPPKTPPGKSHRRNRSDASSSSPQKKKRRPRAFSGSSISAPHSGSASGEHEDPTTPKSTRQPSPHIVPYSANVAHTPVYRIPTQYGYYNSGFQPAPPPPPLHSLQSMGMPYPRQRVDYEGAYNGPWTSTPMRIEGTRLCPKGLNSEYYEQSRLDIPQIMISNEDDSEYGDECYSGSGEDQNEEEQVEGEEQGKGKGKAAGHDIEDKRLHMEGTRPRRKAPPLAPPPNMPEQPSWASQQPRRGSPPSRRTGYPYVAQKLTSHPSLALYRRFSTLNHLVLLHLQDEISELESILAELDTAEYLLNAGLGLRSRRVGSGGGAKRVQVMGAVAWKLREYNTALKSFADAADNLETAREEEIMEYRKWLSDERPLVEPEARFIENREDLISLRKKPKAQFRVTPTTPPLAQESPPPEVQAQVETKTKDIEADTPRSIHKKPYIYTHLPFSRTTKVCVTIILVGLSAAGGWALSGGSEMQVPAAFAIGAFGGALGVMWAIL